MCSWNPYGTVSVFLMGPFILLINWTLVKYVFMKFLMEPCVHFLWYPSYYSLIELWINMSSKIPYGTVGVFLMGPFILLINWSLVKCVFMKSLWDRVCISYGTLHITHKLNFGQICVHEILMGPCAFLMGPFLLLINWTLVKSVFMKSLWDRVCISYGTLPISHKLNFGKVCVHKILMKLWGNFLWDTSYYS